jgi:hypothetical protein
MKRRENEKPGLPKARPSLRDTTPVVARRITGKTVVAAMQASPHLDVEIEPERFPMPVRDVAQ